MWSLKSVGFLGFYTSQFVDVALRSTTEGMRPPRIEAALKIGSTAARRMAVDWSTAAWNPRGILSF